MEPTRRTFATGLLLCALLATAHALPPRRSRADSKDNFVAVGTNEIATSVLQSYVDVDANIAFSPLGVSALLAILAEGARGETRDQLVAALHLPADRQETRAAYKTVLSRFKEKHSLNHPEFKNWFYVYKNYTVEQCFRDVLEENYLTEVRDVDKPLKEQTTTNVVEAEEVVAHKPTKFENTGVKVELPSIPSEEEELPAIPSVGEEPTRFVQGEESPSPIKGEVSPSPIKEEPAKPSEGEEPPRPIKEEEPHYPVKGEGLDADNLPANLSPIAQVPINPSSLENLATPAVDATRTSHEDSIRTIMVQEAVAMQEALKDENKENKTAEFIKEREQVIKEALEKDVVEKEQIKVAVEEQIQTEKEMQVAIADKIEKQEAIKEALEKDMAKEEDMIQVAVVVMNDEEVKQDGVFKEEHVDFDREDEDDEPLPPFKNVSIFDVIHDKTDDLHIPASPNKEYIPEEAKPETGAAAEEEKEPPFVNVSIFDHPNYPLKNPNRTHSHPTKHQKVPTKTDKVTEESEKKKPEIEPEESMMTLERKVRSAAEEVTSSFSGNNLVSKTSTTEKATSMMIAFNALYFKGSWKTPFMRQMADGPHSFYTSDTKKIAVDMMHSEGSFNIGKISALDAVAIDLPYEGGRYSLLLLLPNSRTGLRKLIADLSGYSLSDLSKTLTSQHVEVCLPSFAVQTTTKPIRALEKFGVSHVFSKENANLSGITRVNGLFVQDMSQLVTLNVELTSSSANFLTASSEAASKRGDADKFIADRPFLYFVHDIVDNIIIVAGKIIDPSVAPDVKAEEI